MSSLAGGRPLVEVSEPVDKDVGVYRTYRAQFDTSWTRYERMEPSFTQFRWRARTTDGIVMTFGDPVRADGCPVSDQLAPLTGMVDAFGNEVSYHYRWQGDECIIQEIYYGQNGSLPPFARVVVSSDTLPACGGIHPNSQIDFRTGKKIVTGANRISTITAYALVPGASTVIHTRQITLGYDANSESCTALNAHAPIRLLTSIQESAWGVDSPRVDLPAVTFEYNPASVVRDAPVNEGAPPWAVVAPMRNLGWGYRRVDARWPSVEMMLLDIDGDGLQDLVRNDSVDTIEWKTSVCRAKWRRNNGPDAAGQITFEGLERDIVLPRLKWGGAGNPDAGAAEAARQAPYFEGCSLNGQATLYENSNEQHGACHDGSLCEPSADPTNEGGPYCYPGGTECPAGDGGVANGPFHTYLAYRWLDVDSDGLVDLVAAVHGDIDRYDIGLGNRLLAGGTIRGPEPAISGLPGVGGQPWPQCPGPTTEKCHNFGTCIEENNAVTCGGGLCEVDWSVINQCLTEMPTMGCHQVMAKTVAPPTNAPPPGNVGLTRAPYTRCDGLYPWFIYRNQGNGVFADTATVKYQPVPLESASGDSSFTGPWIASESHAIMDFDGDGFLDAIARDTETTGFGALGWQVWLGDGTGGFAPTAHYFPTRWFNCLGTVSNPCQQPGDNAISGTGASWGEGIRSSRGTIDLNGDGLPDHWMNVDAATNANIAFHDGVKFRLFDPWPRMGEVMTPTDRTPGNDQFIEVTNPVPWLGLPIVEAETTARNRVVDIDHDGRPDIVTWALESPASTPKLYLNLGGQFKATGPDYAGDLQGIRRKAFASASPTDDPHEAFAWRLNADLIDLDGDGVDESVYFNELGEFHRAEPAAQPLRLLKKIDNQRGAHTTISYAQMHDDAVVEQNPEQTWHDGRPKASPRTQWVVKSMSAYEQFSNTTATTAYFYKNPRYSRIEHSYSFRGFEEVRTKSPGANGLPDGTGSTTIQRYDYQVDPTGRLASTLVQPGSNDGPIVPGEVRSIVNQSWQAGSLFGGALKTFHPWVTENLTCANGQTDPALGLGTACTAASAPGYTRTTVALSGYPMSPGNEMLLVESGSMLQSGVAPADGDRETLTTYQLDVGATKYFLHPETTTRFHRVAGSLEMYGKSESTWDPVYGTHLTEKTWVDADPNHAVTARWFYDDTTGNVLEKWKPKQNAAGTTKTTYLYDDRKLFVSRETNEAGHVFDFKHEYGTGVKLQTDGPNQRGCTTGPTCPLDATHPLKEQHKIRVDGLGRPTKRWETVGFDGSLYELHEVENWTYVDTLTTSAASSTSRFERLDVTSSVWKQSTSEHDGRGRLLRETLHTQGTAPADQITTFAYDAGGNLSSVSVPDPPANDASVVTYTYTFDSLDRPTSIRRPDAVAMIDRSGVAMKYDGVTSTTTEIVGPTLAQVSETKTVNDKLGRLSQVLEKTGTETYATTTYEYGPDDLVNRITDPENAITLLKHDFAGHRIQITRPGGRIWKYSYDANGNVESETVPYPGAPNPVVEADYTSWTAYDDLDRPSSKLIAPRDLSAPDLALFGSFEELFTWDFGANRIGRLRYWGAYGPGTSTSTLAANLAYDAQGNLTTNNRSATLAGYAQLARQIYRSFYIFGGVANTRYRDYFNGGSNEVRTNTFYDARGLPKKIVTQTAPILTIGDQTRNVAGLVIKRKTITGGTDYVESNWTYDKLGRVTDQLVQRSQTPTQVARQQLTYFGNDDVKTLAHALGTSSRTFTYAYDRRHQITDVTTDDPNYFQATYGYGDAGRFASAAQSRTGTHAGADPRLIRNVSYVYGGNDPEQVTALNNVPSGTTYAAYTYDEAGNQRTRSYPDSNELFEYLYDGRNQLRRVTRKVSGSVTGSEEYWYDESGKRSHIVKRDAGGAKTEMVWFHDDVQAHYDAAGTITKIYSHLSLGTPVARVERTSNTTTNFEFQFHGLANNTLAAVAQDGTINTSFRYAPFGEVLEATNATGTQGPSVHRRRLNDKIIDEISDLAYFGKRYYDNVSYGWTQSDPRFRFAPDAAWTSPRRANLYTFSLHNPVRYVDPDGENAAAIIPAIVEAIIVMGPSVIAVGLGGSAQAVDTAHPSPLTEALHTLNNPPPAPTPTPPPTPSGIGPAIVGATIGAAVGLGKTLTSGEGTGEGTGSGTGSDIGSGSGTGSGTGSTPDGSGSDSKNEDSGPRFPVPLPGPTAPAPAKPKTKRLPSGQEYVPQDAPDPPPPSTRLPPFRGATPDKEPAPVAPLGCGGECIRSF